MFRFIIASSSRTSGGQPSSCSSASDAIKHRCQWGAQFMTEHRQEAIHILLLAASAASFGLTQNLCRPRLFRSRR